MIEKLPEGPDVFEGPRIQSGGQIPGQVYGALDLLQGLRPQSRAEGLLHSAYAGSGMRPWFFASQASKVCSSGFRLQANAGSRAPQNTSLKSRLNWNMLPRSSPQG